MINHLSKSIALFFAKKNIILKEEVDSYIYGFQIIFIFLLNWSIICSIMVYTGKFIETLLYMCSILTLRHHTGGYHAKTPIRCCILSVSTYILILFALNLIIATNGIICLVILLTISLVCILKFAPIVHKNNPVSNESLKHHRKCSILYSLLITLIAIVFILIKQYTFSLILALGMFQVSIALLIEKKFTKEV